MLRVVASPHNLNPHQAGFFVPLISDRHGECAGGGDKGDF
ncbi:TPA: antiterminator [Escherichia coli]|uniref:Antiterminator n=1 Tax=Escherichia coli TaxID=562 RepID=A0A369DVS1_ECOLX|nr:MULTISPECIES: antiterminator [Enterobacteriaceae]EAC1529509.1 antiterminator [Escherichia coli]EAC1534257.1 antiterminator [Escherichia coli]EEV9008355.1 antiterminator [Escherichia coli]EEV9947813.1 antiterminator [Escherichia coli]EEW1677104.1 antiterminator [Escherichia coli]